ncbi:DNA binding protein, putative (plasmid) [Alkalihalophilus pseudofirmus OF4]|uniref:DNA binding protein, putative n=1 Tax=Alkalihalophilus pseudofirmus (strain ATCC BAA-2126 / JCM 17055 / OF4) TaxID=398511 RepID=D3G1M8_ALKPO|nr:helix-turn-helix transcriptional regulator [Alkalihalophilus pseudofirmus]ADC52254.1 DNA binding protein, putative [Alkalihalophilus pseudofirmus OF4]
MNNYLTGDKIRYYRKEKKMSLKELAQGICSVTKMSNIELGQSNATDPELEKIASKLEIPLSYIKIAQEDTTIIKQINEIEDLIYLDQMEKAKELISKIKDHYNTHIYLNAISIELYYINGLYCYYSNEHDRATQELNNALFCEPSKNVERLTFKIKTYLLLSRISYEEKNYEKSLIQLIEAKKIADTKVSVFYMLRNTIHLNLCIHYILLGKLALANIFIDELDLPTQPLVTLVRGTLAFCEKDYVQALSYADETRSAAQETSNKELILKSLSLKMKIHKVNGQDEEYTNLLEVLKTYLSSFKFPTNHLYLSLAQDYLQEAISQGDMESCQVMFDYLFNIKKKSPFISLHYKTHHLYAKYLKHFSNNYEGIQYHLNCALEFCPEYQLLDRAIITHELAELNYTPESSYKTSSKLFYEHIRKQSVNNELHFFLPMPIF